MSRKLAFGLAALIIIAGAAFGSYQAGWWPGSKSDSEGTMFAQSRIADLRADASAAATASKDMAAADPAGKEVLRQQGNAVVTHACTVSGEIPQLPTDLADFVKANCANGEVSAGSEFADQSGGAAATPSGDPDPGAN